MNPNDAAAANVADGDQVTVTSATGSVSGIAFVTDLIRVGAVSVPHGWGDPCVNTRWSATATSTRSPACRDRAALR